jgi:hypothetical protein
VIDVAGCASGIDPNRPAVRIHADAPRRRQVDHQPTVAATETWAVVSAAPDREEQTLLLGEVYGADDIGDVGAARDEARPFVTHAVV